MKKQTAAKVVFTTGVLLFLLTVFSIYKDFYEPKIGPIGTGERHWTTYATYTSAVIGSIVYTLYGAYLLIQSSKKTGKHQ